MNRRWVKMWPALKEEPATFRTSIPAGQWREPNGSKSVPWQFYPYESEVHSLKKMLGAERRMNNELRKRLSALPEPTLDMIACGAAVLHDQAIEKATLRRGVVEFPLRETIMAIWRAMEKAR